MTLFAGTGLACRRGGRNVFAGVAFDLAAGGALRLLGRNGAGKSSLLRLMAGLGRPLAGKIAWSGEGITDDREAHAARLHYVGHADAVKPALTVAESLSYWAKLKNNPSFRRTPESSQAPALDSGVRRNDGEILEALDLTALANRPGRLLSSGQRRRLALTRLLTAPSQLWLLDEPTVGLDTASITALTGMIAAHRAGGGVVVVATHTPIELPGAAELVLDDYPAAGNEPWA